MQHFDSNGWPCIGKYIGLLDDNDNEPIFTGVLYTFYGNNLIYILKQLDQLNIKERK